MLAALEGSDRGGFVDASRRGTGRGAHWRKKCLTETGREPLAREDPVMTVTGEQNLPHREGTFALFCLFVCFLSGEVDVWSFVEKTGNECELGALEHYLRQEIRCPRLQNHRVFSSIWENPVASRKSCFAGKLMGVAEIPLVAQS